MPDDAALYLAYARRGDVESLATLVARHARRLGAFLNGLLPSDEAEDAFQDTWRRVIEKAGDYRGGLFEAYLVTVARRVAIDRLRRRRPAERLDAADEDGASPLDDVADPAPPPDAVFASRADAEAVRRAVRDLPPGPRQVVLMRIEGEMAFKDIAAELGVPLGTALTWMHAATARLRRALGEERPEKPERPERSERPERPEKPERSERSERSERPERRKA